MPSKTIFLSELYPLAWTSSSESMLKGLTLRKYVKGTNSQKVFVKGTKSAKYEHSSSEKKNLLKSFVIIDLSYAFKK